MKKNITRSNLLQKIKKREILTTKDIHFIYFELGFSNHMIFSQYSNFILKNQKKDIYSALLNKYNYYKKLNKKDSFSLYNYDSKCKYIYDINYQLYPYHNDRLYCINYSSNINKKNFLEYLIEYHMEYTFKKVFISDTINLKSVRSNLLSINTQNDNIDKCLQLCLRMSPDVIISESDKVINSITAIELSKKGYNICVLYDEKNTEVLKDKVKEDILIRDSIAVWNINTNIFEQIEILLYKLKYAKTKRKKKDYTKKIIKLRRLLFI